MRDTLRGSQLEVAGHCASAPPQEASSTVAAHFPRPRARSECLRGRPSVLPGVRCCRYPVPRRGFRRKQRQLFLANQDVRGNALKAGFPREDSSSCRGLREGNGACETPARNSRGSREIVLQFDQQLGIDAFLASEKSSRSIPCGESLRPEPTSERYPSGSGRQGNAREI